MLAGPAPEQTLSPENQLNAGLKGATEKGAEVNRDVTQHSALLCLTQGFLGVLCELYSHGPRLTLG